MARQTTETRMGRDGTAPPVVVVVAVDDEALELGSEMEGFSWTETNVIHFIRRYYNLEMEICISPSIRGRTRIQ